MSITVRTAAENEISVTQVINKLGELNPAHVLHTTVMPNKKLGRKITSLHVIDPDANFILGETFRLVETQHLYSYYRCKENDLLDLYLIRVPGE